MTAMKEDPCPNARKRPKRRRWAKIKVMIEDPSQQEDDDWVETEEGLKDFLIRIHAAADGKAVVAQTQDQPQQSLSIGARPPLQTGDLNPPAARNSKLRSLDGDCFYKQRQDHPRGQHWPQVAIHRRHSLQPELGSQAPGHS
jgi:hypothetical protein